MISGWFIFLGILALKVDGLQLEDYSSSNSEIEAYGVISG